MAVGVLSKVIKTHLAGVEGFSKVSRRKSRVGIIHTGLNEGDHVGLTSSHAQ